MSGAPLVSPSQRRARLYRRILFTVFVTLALWMIVATIVGVFGDITSARFPTRGS